MWPLTVAQKTAVATVLAVLVLSCLSRLTDSDRPYYSKQTIKHATMLVVKSRDSLRASQQDTDPLFALQDVLYGLTYLRVAKNEVSAPDLQKLTRIDLTELQYALDAAHTSVLSQLYKQCPTLDTS